MTKTDIIDNMLRESGLKNVSGAVIAELHRRLPDGIDLKTCEDFKYLGAECCEVCHSNLAHTEMMLIDLPDGGVAWICDAVEWAIYPERHQALKDWENSPEGKMILAVALGKETNQ